MTSIAILIHMSVNVFLSVQLKIRYHSLLDELYRTLAKRDVSRHLSNYHFFVLIKYSSKFPGLSVTETVKISVHSSIVRKILVTKTKIAVTETKIPVIVRKVPVIVLKIPVIVR